MQNDHHEDGVDDQKQSRASTSSVSSRILKYCLLCGAAAVLSGYMALVGTIAEDFSGQIIRNYSFTFAFFAIFAIPVGVASIFLSGLLVSKWSNSVVQTGAQILSDLVVGSFAVLLLTLAFVGANLLLQLSFGQFLFGDEEIQYRHLMMLSAYGGTLFGIFAGWNSKSTHRLSWAVSIWHGLRVSVEAAFLAYAGLWLSRAPFDYALAQGKEGNWDIFAITLLGVSLVFAGTLSLMFRQSQIRPEVTENIERVPIRTRIQQGIQDLKRIISAIKSGIKRFIGLFRNRSQRIRTKVQPGGKMEITIPELEAGQEVEVVVRLTKYHEEREG